LSVALEQVARLRDEPVGEAELMRVRDFAKGRIELRLEDTRGVSSWLAGQELFLGRVRTVDELCAIIDSIGPADVQRVARQYLRPELTYVAAVGPRAALASLDAAQTELVMEKAS
jgi:predicted Zn-dependent peptidase